MPEFAQPGWLALIAALALVVIVPTLRRTGRDSMRSIAAASLRLLSLTALALALAGPLADGYSRHADLVFVLDVSRSMARESIATAVAEGKCGRRSRLSEGTEREGGPVGDDAATRPSRMDVQHVLV